MASKRIEIIVRGRVTGVFFRASAVREARRLGLTGWVKNKSDGTVEIVAEGEDDAIKDMMTWANHGPSAARVDQVQVRWLAYTGDRADFRIVK